MRLPRPCTLVTSCNAGSPAICGSGMSESCVMQAGRRGSVAGYFAKRADPGNCSADKMNGGGPALNIWGSSNCSDSTAFLDLEALRSATADQLGIPPCQVGLNFTYGLPDHGERRRLLQDLSPNQIEIVIEAFSASNVTAGLIGAPDFSDFLATFFNSLGAVEGSQLVLVRTAAFGGIGDDYLYGDDAQNLYGGDGDDVLVGENNTLSGNEGDDILVGTHGITEFFGGPGRNIIVDGRGLSYNVTNADNGTDIYAVCVQNNKGRNWGCSDGEVCKLTSRRWPGRKQAGNVCVPGNICDAISLTKENDLLTLAPTCNGTFLVQGQFKLSFSNCSNATAALDLEALRNAIADELGIPPCQVGLNFTYGLPETQRRRLLQDLSSNQIEIIADIVSASDVTGGIIAGLVGAPDFTAFLANFFDTLGIEVEGSQLVLVRTAVLSSAASDPHFVTARSDMFDFVGRAEQTYCVLSDARVHVNARLVGATSDNVASIQASKDASIKWTDTAVLSQPVEGDDTRTWMGQVAVLYGKDRVLVDANSRPGAPYAASFGTVLVNGNLHIKN
eukprot:jgi/Mesvir1/24893/Mv22116-RA.1